ncbi:unnamed protein product [Staurois parvus]|uniref:Uncharacterized protein n=1 Tax=Staurois parvus TaxID=386267 RepID=A0ABN9D617_9NEOB|nr:unnamed protein product [Staurois parvus]
MARHFLGHMTGSRRRRAIHKAQHFSCMCSPQSLGHPLHCLQSLVIPCTVCSL